MNRKIQQHQSDTVLYCSHTDEQLHKNKLVIMAGARSRDPYRFENQDDVPAIPRDALTIILKHWDDTADPSSYLKYFTSDAVLKFGGDHHGHDGIRAARDSMIHPEKGPIVKCQHFFQNAFVLAGSKHNDNNSNDPWEIIGVADVKYTLVDNNEVFTRAASWARIVNDGRVWKAQEYEVFMDGSKLFAAMGSLSSS